MVAVEIRLNRKRQIVYESQRLEARPSGAGLEPASRATRFTGGGDLLRKRDYAIIDAKEKRIDQYETQYYRAGIQHGFRRQTAILYGLSRGTGTGRL